MLRVVASLTGPGAHRAAAGLADRQRAVVHGRLPSPDVRADVGERTGALAGAERFAGLADLRDSAALATLGGEGEAPRRARARAARQRHTPESRAAVATARPMRSATCLSSGSGRMRSGVGSIT